MLVYAPIPYHASIAPELNAPDSVNISSLGPFHTRLFLSVVPSPSYSHCSPFPEIVSLSTSPSSRLTRLQHQTGCSAKPLASAWSYLFATDGLKQEMSDPLSPHIVILSSYAYIDRLTPNITYESGA